MENILVIGDIHGEFDILNKVFKRFDLRNSVIFVAGDFGVGFTRKDKEIRHLKLLNDGIKHRNNYVFAVRGNHDDPSYFTGEYDQEHVKLLSDYSITSINNINILPIGGADSVDRKYRKSYLRNTKNDNPNKINDWWEDENVLLDKNKLRSINEKTDVVISHSAPDFCEPLTKEGLIQWMVHDGMLKRHVELERQNLAEIYNILIKNNHPLKYWFYGHFHKSYRTEHENTLFYGLDINEIREIEIR